MKRKVMGGTAVLMGVLCLVMAGCRSKKEVTYNHSVDRRVFVDKNSGASSDSTFVTSSKTTKIRRRKGEVIVTEITTVSVPTDSIAERP